MKAVIMAAGKGVRMRPLTDTTPKPLLKVGGIPILDHIVSRLPAEITELIIVIGYLGEQIQAHCGEEYLGRKVQYVRQTGAPGTYMALKACEPLIPKGERFIVMAADDIHGSEGMRELLKHDRALLVAEVEDPRRFGVVCLNEDGSVAEFIEKPEVPPSNLVSTCVLLLDTDVFKNEAAMHPNGEYFLTSAVEKMLKAGYKFAAVKSSLWIPVGFPEDIEKAERRLDDEHK